MKRLESKRRIAACCCAGALILSLSGCLGKSSAPPNDPLYPEQVALSSVQIEKAWERGLTGKGVKIAVIDTGVNEHEDLDMGRITGKSYVDDHETSYGDIRGHGTFITGLLIAKRNNDKGIVGMTQSDLVMYKVFGEKPHISIDDVARAIRDAADNGCAVINISMGTPNENEGLKEAVDYAIAKNVIIVAAAGGNSEEPCYPAAYEGVIGVDVVSIEMEALETSVRNESVFVTAPGEKHVSLASIGGYERNGAGASYATALVTSMAAMVKQKLPETTASEFMEIVKQACVDKGETGYDTVYGWGVIDFAALPNAINTR